MVPGADPVNRVTIMPSGQALGVTYQRPEADRHNYHEGYLRARITGALGGRAAEEVVYGSRTTGSESDMEQATNLARQMVTRWGMSEALGPVTLAPRDNQFLPGQSGFGCRAAADAQRGDQPARGRRGAAHPGRMLRRRGAAAAGRIASRSRCWRRRSSTVRRSTSRRSCA